MNSLKAINLAHMRSCPHCAAAIDKFRKNAKKLGVQCVLHDVYNESQAGLADEIVRKHGDWSDDYIVPQVFFETTDSLIVHVLTGYPEGVEFTERAINNLQAINKGSTIRFETKYSING